MKSQQFIPSNVEPLDSDDSSIHGDEINGIDATNETSDSETLENIVDDSDSNFSPKSDTDGDFESDISSESEAENEDDNDDDESKRKVSDEVGEVEEVGDDGGNLKCSELNDKASTSKDDADDADSDGEGDASEKEDDVTMQEFFGIRPNQETLKNRPPDMKAETAVLDVCFHPENDLLSTATLDGDVVIYSYTTEEIKEVCRFSHHKSSCRQVAYNQGGTLLYTISKDKSLAVVDVEKSVTKTHMREAHKAPIYCFFELDVNRCATGDDDGIVKLWDLRQQKPIFDFKCSEETVTSLIACEENKFLSATLADGSLTGFNLRKNRVESQSEMFDSEFVSQSLVRNESRLAVGTESGCLHLFRWGDFGYKVDAFGGHPNMILCQGSLTDKLILTGCEDGNIRAVHLYPHRFMGIVGQHKDYGVENLSVSHDGSYLASCSKEDVYFWNIDYLYQMKEPAEKKVRNKKMLGARNMQSSRQRDKRDFFRDFPTKMESDSDDCGPVTGTGYQSD